MNFKAMLLSTLVAVPLFAQQPLVDAVNAGNKTEVQRLIRAGASPNGETNTKGIPLMYAIAKKDLEMVRLLLTLGADPGEGFPLQVAIGQRNRDEGLSDGQFAELGNMLFTRGLDINATGNDGNTLLQFAVMEGDLPAVRYLYGQGASPNEGNAGSGWTPLIQAASDGNGEILSYLIDRGASVDGQDKDGCTPLMFAVRDSSLQNTRLLLQAGAGPNIRHEGGYTAAFIAANKSVALTELLLSYGADVRSVDGRGRTFAHAAAFAEDSVKIFKLLAGWNADFNAKDSSGMTPLMVAAGAPRAEGLEFLLAQRGIKISEIDGEGANALHHAAHHERLESVRLLLQAGMDANSVLKNGLSALHLAARDNTVEIARLLLSYGATPDIADEDGDTPLMVAEAKGHKGAILSLLASPNQKGNLHSAVLAGDAAAVTALSKAGANLNLENSEGVTPLNLAIQRSLPKMAELLLNLGAAPDLAPGGGARPLHHAASKGDAATIRLLLNKKASPAAADEDGNTPLHRLARTGKGNAESLALLLDGGAAIDAIGSYGDTPLLMAIRNNEGLVPMLLQRGADVTLTNEDGITALHFAAAFGKEAYAALLLDRGAAVNARDNDGGTPLLAAIQNGEKNMVKFLLGRGAGLDENGESSLISLIDGKYWGAVGILLGMGQILPNLESAQTNSLLRAATEMPELAEALANLGLSDDNGNSLLILALQAGNEDVAKLLINKGADVSRAGYKGVFPLLLAALNGDRAMAELLLAKGASLGQTDGEGWTALHGAALAGSESTARFLFQRGASLAAKTSAGETPAMLTDRQNLKTLLK